MYCRYAETQGWRVEILSTSESAQRVESRRCIALVTGKDVYGAAPLRRGSASRPARARDREPRAASTHRRPPSPCSPRPRTSTSTSTKRTSRSASLRAAGPAGRASIPPTAPSRSSTSRAASSSSVRTSVRSSRTRAKALKVLRARLLDIEREKAEARRASARRSMVSTGERSQKIRTYNYPQNRVSDHRIKLTLNKLDRIIEGDIGELITALRTHRQAELLHDAGLGDAPCDSRRRTTMADPHSIARRWSTPSPRPWRWCQGSTRATGCSHGSPDPVVRRARARARDGARRSCGSCSQKRRRRRSHLDR